MIIRRYLANPLPASAPAVAGLLVFILRAAVLPSPEGLILRRRSWRALSGATA